MLGRVDPETQRVAVRLGEDDELVIETGFYKLTLVELPVMVHFGSNQTEFSLLVRMQEPDGYQEEVTFTYEQ